MAANTGANHLKAVLKLIILLLLFLKDVLFVGVRARGAQLTKDATTEAVLHSRSSDSAAG